MSMSNLHSLDSLRVVVEKAIRDTFMQEVNALIDKEHEKAKQVLHDKFESIKRNARKSANECSLQILQKANLNGITVEFKL